MAMDRVEGAGTQQPRPLDGFARSGELSRSEDSARANRNDTAERPAASPEKGLEIRDRAEISDGARKIAELKSTLEESRMAYDEAPEIRRNRVDEAKSRLASGYYDSVQVKDTLAARLGAVVRRMDDLLD